MKIGLLLLIIAFLLVLAAGIHQGWWWLLLWPAFSFALAAAGYFYLGPCVFGKSEQGLIPLRNQFLLLPYLLYLIGIWHLSRLIRQEQAIHQLTDTLLISRRLLSKELPCQVVHVIDLTCEFNESQALRSVGYFCFPILDRSVPSQVELRTWIEKTASLEGTVLVHCAEGHGRTGLFTAALLLDSGQAETVAEALQLIQRQRPRVRLSREQKQMLEDFSNGL